MITFKQGDLFSEDVEALVNPVNCVGVAGKGLALQFRLLYPHNNVAYKRACVRGQVQPGSVLVVPFKLMSNPRYIVNFPTKKHWKNPSRIEYIADGLHSLVEAIHKYNIRSIAIPPLGCGLGGLNWMDVRPLIESALSPLEDLTAVVLECLPSY